MIINNNNNNNNGFGNRTGNATSKKCVSHETDSAPLELSSVFSAKLRDRTVFVRLAYQYGWGGLHEFYLGKRLLATLNILLTLIGVSAFVVLVVLTPVLQIELSATAAKLLGYSILAFFISILLAVAHAVYWNLHSDADFDKTFNKNQNNE